MKTIMLSDEAYKKLASIKGSKSFTELILELVDKFKGVRLADVDKFLEYSVAMKRECFR